MVLSILKKLGELGAELVFFGSAGKSIYADAEQAESSGVGVVEVEMFLPLEAGKVGDINQMDGGAAREGEILVPVGDGEGFLDEREAGAAATK